MSRADNNFNLNGHTLGFHSQTQKSEPRHLLTHGLTVKEKVYLPAHLGFFPARYESQMELLKKSHSREMDKLKRSSGDGVDGLQTEVVQLQVEMENMSQKYMEEIESLKVRAFPALNWFTSNLFAVPDYECEQCSWVPARDK